MLENYGVINDRAPHIVADLCEIIAFFEARDVSRGDIETFISEKGGNGLLRGLDLQSLSGAEANEKFQAFTEEAFRHLIYRRRVFADWYPFTVENDVISPKDITDRHLVYAALLGYSRLKMFANADRINYAAEFETLCYQAANGLFPEWNVYHFGVGGADRAAFGNKLNEALRALAVKLRDSVAEARIAELSEQNTGDGGVDIVVMKEWSDPAESLPVYFGQCAAQQENWPEKRFEAHPVTLSKYFNFFHEPGALIFIPVCYRNPDGNWVDSAGHPAIVVDRLRIIEMLDYVLEHSEVEIDIKTYFKTPFTLGCANIAADV